MKLFGPEQRARAEKLIERDVPASIERAAQRERDQHQFQGNKTARKAAQAMWRDFLADPKLAKLSGRDLTKRYKGGPTTRISYRAGDRHPGLDL